MTRPSVYDQLRTLANIGLVHERDEGKSVFGIHDPRDLERLLVERTERIAGIRRSLPSGLAMGLELGNSSLRIGLSQAGDRQSQRGEHSSHKLEAGHGPHHRSDHPE
jgi:hypothetical protein